MVTAVLAGAVVSCLLILLVLRGAERSVLERQFQEAIREIQCPHQLHGRLKVYNRPIQKAFRKDVYPLCAGCGKRMGDELEKPE